VPDPTIEQPVWWRMGLSSVRAQLDDLRLEAAGSGLRMQVRVSPGARKEALLGLYGHVLKVAVRAPPERGRANRALIDLLARALEVPRRTLRVVAGETSRDKTLLVSGLDAQTIRARLGGRMAGPETAGG